MTLNKILGAVAMIGIGLWLIKAYKKIDEKRNSVKFTGHA